MASTMKDYTKPEYKGLYKEILKDQQWTWGKFNPIPYPTWAISTQDVYLESKSRSY